MWSPATLARWRARFPVRSTAPVAREPFLVSVSASSSFFLLF